MKYVLTFIKDHITLILALCSAYLYFCIYSYETSYLKAFNVPSSYVMIDVNTILLDGSHIILILLIIGVSLILSNALTNNLKKRFPRIAKFVSYSYILGLAAVVVTFVGDSTQSIERNIGYFVAVLELIIIVFCFFAPIDDRKSEDSINDIKDAESVIEVFESGVKVITRFILIIGFMFTFVIIDNLGAGQAKHQSEFQVVDSTNYVVIRKYGDQLLCIDYDTTKKVIGKKIILVKLYSNKPLSVTTKNIGRIADTLGQLESYKQSILVMKPKITTAKPKQLKRDSLSKPKPQKTP